MLKQQLIFISVSWLLSTNSSAQIVTDGTLGPAQNLQGPNYQIENDLGQQRGNNIFHSFQEFNLQAGETASFSGPDNIQNVISRITGGNSSRIDGTIHSKIPNFYFLNPYGIMFGPNARLDVPGSFHAGTVDSLFFADGSYFSATENIFSPILTVAPPEAFGFLNMPPAPLSIYGTLLEIKENQKENRTLFLLGSPLTITNATLFAPYGDINLVGLNELQMTNSTVYAPAGQISLLATALQNVIPTSFEMLAANAFREGSTINIVDNPFQRMADPMAGGIFFNHVNHSKPLREKWESRPPGGIANIDTNGEGGGKIVIRSGQFFLDTGSIYADNFGNRDGGGIDIKVRGNMHLTNSARITAEARVKEENVRGGDIFIQAGKLEMSGVSTQQVFQGVREVTESPIEFERRFGMDRQAYFQQRFNMNEQETLNFLTNLRAVFSELLEQSTEVSLYMIGNRMSEKNEKYAMPIPDLFKDVLNTIRTRSFDMGSGGNIIINTQILSAEHTLIGTATEGSGPAGNININAQQIKLSDYSRIDASTVGLGQAGNLTIDENDSFFLSNFSSITASSSRDSFGQAGNIFLNTKELTLKLGQINSFSEGHGNAGSINITANVATLINESGIHTSARSAGGGNITLNISDRLQLTDNSWITAEALGSKPQDSGGNITIAQPGLFTSTNSLLRADAYGGDGGKIEIKTDDFYAINTHLLAHAELGDGGNIDIDANNFNFVGGKNKIDVSSTFGLNGNLKVNSIEFKENYSLLPSKLSPIPTLVCPPISINELPSSFKLKGRGGMLDLPDQLRGGALLDFSVNGTNY